MKFFTLLREGEVHSNGGKKIIPAEEYTQLVDAAEMYQKAQQNIEQLKAETQKACEQSQAEAKEQGFQEGLEQFNAAILKMDEGLKALRLDLQQLVLPIALKAAKRIVGKELEMFPETIVDIVIQVIQPISQSRYVTIFVSKKDKEHLEHNKPKLREILQQVEAFIIQEKPEIEPGGCTIKTESGMINATIENQWRALERAFEKYKQSP